MREIFTVHGATIRWLKQHQNYFSREEYPPRAPCDYVDPLLTIRADPVIIPGIQAKLETFRLDLQSTPAGVAFSSSLGGVRWLIPEYVLAFGDIVLADIWKMLLSKPANLKLYHVHVHVVQLYDIHDLQKIPVQATIKVIFRQLIPGCSEPLWDGWVHAARAWARPSVLRSGRSGGRAPEFLFVGDIFLAEVR